MLTSSANDLKRIRAVNDPSLRRRSREERAGRTEVDASYRGRLRVEQSVEREIHPA